MKRSAISRYNRAVRSSSPLLWAVNLTIAVLILLSFIGGYWFLWRALPQTSGALQAPVSAQASIVRDSLGVPHITAADWRDAIFLQGFVTAQDRLWQMDALRRLAAGELAEVLGPAAVESDREARRLRLPQLASAQEAVLTAEARAIFAAYAQGVNFYLETHRDRLPIEFSLLRYQPRPWRLRDTLLIGLQMTRVLTTTWREELRKQRMLEAGDPAKVAFLYSPDASPEAAPGSNAWAISGAHTASGKPILAADPHLEYSLPSTWYLVHLRAGDLDVTGASLPGVPAVIIGHNRHIAWGMTNLEFDMQDLYAHPIDAQTGRYLYRGQPQQAALERARIPVRAAQPVDLVTLITRHGPLWVTDQNRNYTLQWLTPGEAGPMDFAFLALNRARNWQEFNAALARHPGPPQNFVYADVDGNIGFHVAGQIPQRPSGCPGDVPADGASGRCDWAGVIPYAELPEIYNPPSGIIVSANQNPFPPGYKYPVAGLFAPADRALQIRARLEAKPRWTAAEMLAVQKDVYSAFLHFLAREAVRAWQAKPQPALTDAVERLRAWNGQMERGLAAPLVAALLYDELRRSLAEAAAPGRGGDYSARFAAPAIRRLLRERPAGWFPDYDAWLLSCLERALETGRRAQGSNIARWDYGQYVRLTLEHPVLGRLPFIGRYFNLGPVSMTGSTTTVKQLTGNLGPSFRMVADLGDLDASLANLTVGQSGHFLSPHYRDQFAAYLSGTSFPMQFSNVTAQNTLLVNPF
jgi:penicillin amidase